MPSVLSPTSTGQGMGLLVQEQNQADGKGKQLLK